MCFTCWEYHQVIQNLLVLVFSISLRKKYYTNCAMSNSLALFQAKYQFKNRTNKILTWNDEEF